MRTPGVGAMIPVMMTRTMAPGVYDIARVECSARSVVTNTVPVVAYRGAGRPEATAAIERAMDLFAAELGMDPVEVRRRNLIPPFLEPHTTPMAPSTTSATTRARSTRRSSPRATTKLRAEQRERRERGDPVQLGIGVSCYVEITGAALPGSEPQEIARVRDARRRLGHGVHGHVAARAGPRHRVVDDRRRGARHPDGTHRGGARRHRPGTRRDRHLRLALAAAGRRRGPEDQRRGRRTGPRARRRPARGERRRRRPRPRARAGSTSPGRPRWGSAGATWPGWRSSGACRRSTPRARSSRPGPTFPFGAHVAVVEVDLETGKVTLVRHVACDDAGTVLNPLIFEGQVHGGIAQGVAQALVEEFAYDAGGNPLTANFADYTFISVGGAPQLRGGAHGDADAVQPARGQGCRRVGDDRLHARGAVARSSTRWRTSASATSTCRATPERVWRAIAEAAS